MMKLRLLVILIFALNNLGAQEISNEDIFAKCRKEFSKKKCLSDEDKDGILFYLDDCPIVLGSAENNGCPWQDTDGDGVLDKDDLCPKEKGDTENNGCPWLDTDGDGILDKDDLCPTVPGLAEEQGCPSKKIKSYRYSKEELEEVKNKFLEQTKNINYEKLADIIFSKINEKDFDSNVITLEIASFHQMAGCGFDKTDYSPLNLKVNLASERFWNENNFKKFAKKFPDKIIFPYSEKEDINKNLQSFKNIYSKKSNEKTFYNAKNDFKRLKINDLNFEKNFNIYLFFYEESDKIGVRINQNTDLKSKYFDLILKEIYANKQNQNGKKKKIYKSEK